MRSIPLLRGQLDVNYENLQQLAIKFRKINEIEKKAQDMRRKYSDPSSESVPPGKVSGGGSLCFMTTSATVLKIHQEKRMSTRV